MSSQKKRTLEEAITRAVDDLIGDVDRVLALRQAEVDRLGKERDQISAEMSREREKALAGIGEERAKIESDITTLRGQVESLKAEAAQLETQAAGARAVLAERDKLRASLVEVR